jgi:hypothetical protein
LQQTKNSVIPSSPLAVACTYIYIKFQKVYKIGSSSNKYSLTAYIFIYIYIKTGKKEAGVRANTWTFHKRLLSRFELSSGAIN